MEVLGRIVKISLKWILSCEHAPCIVCRSYIYASMLSASFVANGCLMDVSIWPCADIVYALLITCCERPSMMDGYIHCHDDLWPTHASFVCVRMYSHMGVGGMGVLLTAFPPEGF